jgi:poly-gamma-glutamate synthesis protein (capsule biosynthesis protein)
LQKTFQVLLLALAVFLFAAGCGSQNAPSPGEEDLLASLIPPTMVVTPKDQTPTHTAAPTKTPVQSPTEVPFTTIAFTGVIVPARCVHAAVEEVGSADYIYEDVREILTGADITVGVYNATMSDNVEHIGCQRSWELTGGSENASALQAAGFDVMSVATNHIKDCGRYTCGSQAFFDTLANLRQVDILPVGAGATLDEALKPVVVEVNGIRYGFVSLGEVNERVFADFETPGIANLTFFHLKEAVEMANEVSDVVIVLPHSGPEDSYEVIPQQKYWARNAVAFGADLVVENHAHVVQGYQAIEDVMVFYGLGNFVFDQIWSRDHQQGVILLVTFQDTTMVRFDFIPTVVLQDGTVLLADELESLEIIERIELSSSLLSD